MNEDAQNILLKTLEEPPAAVTLILAADEDDQLLPTVRSRAARIRLGPVPAREIEALLVETAGVDAAQAARIARLAGGRPGLAMAYARLPRRLDDPWRAVAEPPGSRGEGPTRAVGRCARRESRALRGPAVALAPPVADAERPARGPRVGREAPWRRRRLRRRSPAGLDGGDDGRSGATEASPPGRHVQAAERRRAAGTLLGGLA